MFSRHFVLFLKGTRWPLIGRFVLSGSRVAFAIVATALISLIFIRALASYPSVVVAAYGMVLSLLLIPLLCVSGLQIAVITKASHTETDQLNCLAGATILASTAIIPVTFVAGEIILSTSIVNADIIEKFNQFFWIRLMGLPPAPIRHFLSGMLIQSGRDHDLFYITITEILLSLISSLVILYVHPAQDTVLIWVGISMNLINMLILVQLTITLRDQLPSIIRLFRTGWNILITAPCRCFSDLCYALAGSGDVFVILSSFWFANLFAAQLSAEAAAITTRLQEFIRTFVVPLKAYGMVAGRLVTMAFKEHRTPFGDLQSFTATMAAIYIPLGLLLIIFPQSLSMIFGDVFYSNEPQFLNITRLVGFQLLLEPWAGFHSSVLKILIAPHATLANLAVSLWGFALPAIALLSFIGTLSLFNMWAILMIARCLFLIQTQIILKNWYIKKKRAFKTMS